MGFVGFTGPTTERYLDWVANNTNTTWDNGAAQLTYMDDRIRNAKNGNESYFHFLKEKFNDPKRGPKEMAKAFYAHYTSGKGPSGEYDQWAQDRANFAQEIWDEYQPSLSEKYPDVPEKRIIPDSELSNTGVENAGGPKGGAIERRKRKGGIGGVTPKVGVKKPMVEGMGGGEDAGMEIEVPNFTEQINSAINSEGKGGDLDYGNYTPSSVPEEVRKATASNVGQSKWTEQLSQTKYKPVEVKDTPTSTTTIQSTTDLTEVISGLKVMAKYLQSIADNTAASTDELATLNTKDFGVDKDMRAALSAASKVKTHKELSKGASTTSMKGIVNLAKP